MNGRNHRNSKIYTFSKKTPVKCLDYGVVSICYRVQTTSPEKESSQRVSIKQSNPKNNINIFTIRLASAMYKCEFMVTEMQVGVLYSMTKMTSRVGPKLSVGWVDPRVGLDWVKIFSFLVGWVISQKHFQKF